MEKLKKFFSHDAYFLIFISLLVIIVTEIPFVYGYFMTDKSHYYTGLNTIASIDGPVYLSYIEQVKAGHLLFRDLFNSNDDFKFFNPFWLLVGLVAKIFHLSGMLALQLFRIILIPLFLWSLFKIIDLLFSGSQWQKKACFLFSIVLSGAGIFIFPLVLGTNLKPSLADVPIDLWAYEANNFMVLRYYPHVILGTSLIFLIFYYFYKATEKHSYRQAIYAGLLGLALFSFHPFQVPIIYAIPFVYLIFLFISEKKINWQSLKIYGLLFLISLPSVVYYIVQLFINNNMYLKAVRNTGWMPTPVIFIFSFGLGLILALYYIYHIFRTGRPTRAQYFLLAWMVTSIFLAYCPFLNWQRRMLGGFIVPVSILAFSAALLIYQHLKALPKPARIFLVIIFFFTITLSDLFVFSQDLKFITGAATDSIKFDDLLYVDNLVYVDNNIKEAADWYKKTAFDSDLILASDERGNIIPGLTAQKVYSGHPIETVGYEAKTLLLKAFFATDTDDDLKQDFLKTNKITYIFYSDFEHNLGDFAPAEKNYLQEVFANKLVTIYKVNLPAND